MREDVLKLAKLARLSLTEEEVDRYTKDVANIFHYIDKLQTINTDGLEPTYQVSGQKSIMRADEVIDYGTTKAGLLKNAPDSQKDMFKVKRMVG